jgi:hypothetical protein
MLFDERGIQFRGSDNLRKEEVEKGDRLEDYRLNRGNLS